jgi:hypothetical protein
MWANSVTRLVASQERADPCSVSRDSATTVAAPIGTIHRLEAIQDSFFEGNEGESDNSTNPSHRQDINGNVTHPLKALDDQKVVEAVKASD